MNKKFRNSFVFFIAMMMVMMFSVGGLAGEKVSPIANIENFTFQLEGNNDTKSLILQKDETGLYYLSIPCYELIEQWNISISDPDKSDFLVRYNACVTTQSSEVRKQVEEASYKGAISFGDLAFPKNALQTEENGLYTEKFDIVLSDGNTFSVYIRPYCELFIHSAKTETNTKCPVYQDPDNPFIYHIASTTDSSVNLEHKYYMSAVESPWGTPTMQINGDDIQLDSYTNIGVTTFALPETGDTADFSVTVGLKEAEDLGIEPRTYTVILHKYEKDYTPAFSNPSNKKFQLKANDELISKPNQLFKQTDKVTLSVESIELSNVDENTTYQWSSTGVGILGTGKTLEIDTDRFYGRFMGTKCVITNTVDGFDYSLTVNQGSAAIYSICPTNFVAPTIVSQSNDVSYTLGETPENLSLSVESDVINPAIAYQWYENNTDSIEGGTAIDGGTKAKLTPSVSSVGEKWYYCETYLKLGSGANTVESERAYTKPIKITVIPAELGMEGSGTEEDPYIIATADNFVTIKNKVAAGNAFTNVYFKMSSDITLPVDWDSIGELKDPKIGHISDGDNLLAFSGNIDGDNHTLTVPEGGNPLLGYVYDASVKNLKIYGKKIAGYGLVNHIEGVHLDKQAITIDNVTLLSGTQTLKAGFAGSYITNNGFAGCSAGFIATIKNCTIEKGVVIGYDGKESMIGSFAGRLICKIENCVSYADVRGVDYVGGIVGTMDNAMGVCDIKNCTFDGSVTATGKYVGGIVGGGYCGASAPNGNIPDIDSCTAKGTIQGADRVGGILGGDPYVVQSWGTETIQNNTFDGKVSATNGTYVGGIIGYLDSLNKYNIILNNQFNEDSGADKGIGFVKYVDTNCKTHETESGTTYFSTEFDTEECPEVSGCNWRAQHNRTDDPLGADAIILAHSGDIDPFAYKLEISGEYKDEYYLGDDLDLSGAVFTATWTDGKTTTPELKDITFTGYNNQVRGEQTVTATYGSAQALFTVTVLKKPVSNEIEVTFSLLGDAVHGEPTEATGTHTNATGNLVEWIAPKVYLVDLNATVKDVLEMALAENNMTCSNPTGNYVKSITKGGVTLGEFDNGPLSGWMYTLNGKYPEKGVKEQYLENGDVIVFHYTDNYMEEETAWNDQQAANAVMEKIKVIGEVTKESGDAIKASRDAYDALSDAQKALVTNYDVLTAAEAKYAELTKKTPVTEIFTDVANRWSLEAIQFAYDNGLMEGVGGGKFDPEGKVSRAMLVQVLYNLEENPEVSGANPFKDVAAGRWYTDAVIWAWENDIIHGYSATMFGPSDSITRQDFAVVMYNYAKNFKKEDVSQVGDLSKFKDTDKISSYALDAMKWANGAGIINGTPAGTLEPQGKASRAEMAQIFMNYLKK